VLGGWQLATGHSATGTPREEIFETWDRALDRGLDVLDCADIYTGVEALIGEYLAARRAAGRPLPRVHTKFVPDLDNLARLDRRLVSRIVERSLTRLGVERLDLVQFHWWDYRVPGYLDGAGWLADLAQQGKIRLVGLTNFDAERTRELLGAAPIASTQVQYSVIDQRPRRALAGVAGAAGVGLLCYGSLAGGFLSERWLRAPEPAEYPNRSLVKYRLIIEDFGGWGRYQALLEGLASVAERHRTNLAAVAMRWVLDQPAVAAVIIGLRRAGHLAAVDSALRLELTESDDRLIGGLTGPDPGPPGDVYDAERVAGGRHAAIMRYDLNARAVD
jgi:aryl-alcohol dehydrogenase-like predicted oxidoreductase